VTAPPTTSIPRRSMFALAALCAIYYVSGVPNREAVAPRMLFTTA
jgi:hypothetical protein